MEKINRFTNNPLDTISDSDFNEFLIAKENDFDTHNQNGIVISDYYKWYDTYFCLRWHCYFNYKKIFEEKNISLSTLQEIIEFLISERKNKINNNESIK
jgi:hypothetical protein